MHRVDEKLDSRSQFGVELRDIIRGEMPLEELTLAAAKLALRAEYLSGEQKRIAVSTIRFWADYANEHDVHADDPYAIRRHITQFAKGIYDRSPETIPLCEVDIDHIGYNGLTYRSVINEIVSPEILSDENVAIYGGTARLALKMFAGVSVEKELPLHDVDAIISSGTNIADRAQRYGIDLAGAKVVEGSIIENLPLILSNADCTMNQVAIYEGKLVYTPAALEDIRQGVIRPTVKHDPLFGTEGAITSSGETYIDKKGFYRGLSFLLRGKGDRLTVSVENLENEKYNIGRYWLIILLVKLLPLKDEQARYEAIGHWQDVASRIGVTETTNPRDFFEELITLYPETRATNTTASGANTDSQTRWIIEKLGDRLVDRTCGRNVPNLPQTYTPSYIERSANFKPYDMDALIESLGLSGHAAHI